MDKVFTVAQVILPILAAIFLGVFARRRKVLTPEENRGLQQFVIQFALPCGLFNSCLTAQVGAESLSTMAMVIPLLLISTLWAFRSGKKHFPYHNLPQMFAAQETGMLGIPLFMILFGSDQAYRVGILDLAQSVIAIPVIAILATDAGENPTVGKIVKKVLTSPLLMMSLLGLALNLTGAGAWLDRVGIGSVITAATSFLAQPVSAVMLFSVGYNFSLSRGNRRAIFRLSGVHFGMFLLFGCLIQGALCLLPNVAPETRWAIALYSVLPASYIAPGLGRGEEDCAVASGVCSVLTVVSLVVFCAMAVLTA